MIISPSPSVCRREVTVCGWQDMKIQGLTLRACLPLCLHLFLCLCLSVSVSVCFQPDRLHDHKVIYTRSTAWLKVSLSVSLPHPTPCMSACHIGGSLLFDSFIPFFWKKEEPPVCVACNTVITVSHILIGCADIVEVTKKYFLERSLYSLFRNVNLENSFDFMKEIGMFCKVWGVLK